MVLVNMLSEDQSQVYYQSGCQMIYSYNVCRFVGLLLEQQLSQQFVHSSFWLISKQDAVGEIRIF